MNAALQDVFVNYARATAPDEPILARSLDKAIWRETAAILPFPPITGGNRKADNNDPQPQSSQPTTPKSGSGGDGPGGEPPSIDWQAKRLITLAEVVSKVPVSRQTIYNWEKTGMFPQRIILPQGIVCWLASEVDDWIAQARSRR